MPDDSVANGARKSVGVTIIHDHHIGQLPTLCSALIERRIRTNLPRSLCGPQVSQAMLNPPLPDVRWRTYEANDRVFNRDADRSACFWETHGIDDREVRRIRRFRDDRDDLCRDRIFSEPVNKGSAKVSTRHFVCSERATQDITHVHNGCNAMGGHHPSDRRLTARYWACN